MKFTRKKTFISLNILPNLLKSRYPDLSISEVGIGNIVNTSNFWIEFIDFLYIYILRHPAAVKKPKIDNNFKTIKSELPPTKVGWLPASPTTASSRLD